MTVMLTEEQKIKILKGDDLYGIMQRILLREKKIDRNKRARVQTAWELHFSDIALAEGQARGYRCRRIHGLEIPGQARNDGISSPVSGMSCAGRCHLEALICGFAVRNRRWEVRNHSWETRNRR